LFCNKSWMNLLFKPPQCCYKYLLATPEVWGFELLTFWIFQEKCALFLVVNGFDFCCWMRTNFRGKRPPKTMKIELLNESTKCFWKCKMPEKDTIGARQNWLAIFDQLNLMDVVRSWAVFDIWMRKLCVRNYMKFFIWSSFLEIFIKPYHLNARKLRVHSVRAEN